MHADRTQSTHPTVTYRPQPPPPPTGPRTGPTAHRQMGQVRTAVSVARLASVLRSRQERMQARQKAWSQSISPKRRSDTLQGAGRGEHTVALSAGGTDAPAPLQQAGACVRASG